MTRPRDHRGLQAIAHGLSAACALVCGAMLAVTGQLTLAAVACGLAAVCLRWRSF